MGIEGWLIALFPELLDTKKDRGIEGLNGKGEKHRETGSRKKKKKI